MCAVFTGLMVQNQTCLMSNDAVCVIWGGSCLIRLNEVAAGEPRSDSLTLERLLVQLF